MDNLLVLGLEIAAYFFVVMLVIALITIGVIHLFTLCEERGRVGELRQQQAILYMEIRFLNAQRSKLKEEIILCERELGHENPADSHGEKIKEEPA